MSILSFEFLIFTAVMLVLYHIFPLKVRWLVLLCGSTFFLCSAGKWSVLYLTLIALTAWFGCRLLPKYKNLLPLFLLLDFGAMLLVKYEAAAAGWLNGRLTESLQIPVWENISVLGLSYFTFQAAGLLIDVSREKLVPERNPLKVWLFIGYFPQLAQGPISTWKEIGEQLTEGHRLEPDRVVSGFILMLWGYFKKLVIADRLAVTTAVLTGEQEELRGWLILFCVILYAIRLYTDFSGGMDVIRGISRMLGIKLPENFQRPFFSKSVAEYWRRWHITLGGWFRTYLMYPITNSRFGLWLGKAASKKLGKKTGRAVPSALSVLIVFLLIGVWHNASMNALIYGAYFGILMAASMLLEPQWKKLNKTYQLKKRKWMPAFRLIRTLLLILPAQYFAFTGDPSLSFSLLKSSFQGWDFAGAQEILLNIMTLWQWGIAAAGMVLLFAIDVIHEKKGDLSVLLAKAKICFRWPLMLLLIFLILVFGVYGEGLDSATFLYTNF